MNRTIVLLLTFFFCNYIFASYPISPQPLRKLVKESQGIIVGNVIKISDRDYPKKRKKNIHYSFYKIAKIAISEVLQGNIKTDTIELQFNPNMVCPSPPMYFENTTVLVFLDFKDGKFDTRGLSYGAKTLDEQGILIYKKRIQEIQKIFKTSDLAVQQQETIEWLVKCVEEPVTRWEGTCELNYRKEFSDDTGEKLIKYLSAYQKSRLKTAFKDSLKDEYYDFELSDLIYDENKEEVNMILLNKLKSISKDNKYYAGEYIDRLKDYKQSEEAKNILREYYDIRFDEDKTERTELLIQKFISQIEK